MIMPRHSSGKSIWRLSERLSGCLPRKRKFQEKEISHSHTLRRMIWIFILLAGEKSAPEKQTMPVHGNKSTMIDGNGKQICCHEFILLLLSSLLKYAVWNQTTHLSHRFFCRLPQTAVHSFYLQSAAKPCLRIRHA